VDEAGLRRLLDVGRSLVTVLDPEIVLRRALEVARELTGARYAAIGVLDASRERLERFVTAGIDDEARRAIGDPPRGHGVLGVLIKDPRPLRLPDVSRHPESYGFPGAHPPMKTFLGVPIVIEGRAWGNLYLTDKDAGEFTDDDEETAVVLADWAAIAIANGRLYRDVRERRDELERTIRGLETTTEISRALGGVTDLEHVLELVAKRSRALLDARAAAVELDDVSVLAGEPVAGEPALVAPVSFRNRPLGSLKVYGGPFGAEDERLLRAFAASAATAVATAQNATEEALRRAIEASEAERGRWARELHDETLQQFAGLRMLLSGARRSGDRERVDTAIETALERIATGIGDLRGLITDLRPAALDELGIEPALESLAERAEVGVALRVELAARPAPELESTIYRLVQEALTNVAKHARASHVSVLVREAGDALEVLVRDDGAGFDPHRRSSGYGLVGMRERLALVRGTLDIESAPGGGTTLRASIPYAAA
jgi:signal transduction histidine kinase